METAEGGLSQGIAGRGGFTDQPDRGIDLSPMKRSKSQQDLDLGIVGIGGKSLLANYDGFGRGSLLPILSGMRQDRKRFVLGTSGSGGLDVGGGHFYKKKKE